MLLSLLSLGIELFYLNFSMVMKRCRRRLFRTPKKTTFHFPFSSSTGASKSSSRLNMSAWGRCQRLLPSSTTYSSNSSSKSFRFNTFFGSKTFFLLVLFLMVCGGNSQASFSQVKSGNCGSVSGRVDISDKATCSSAARKLGLRDYSAYEWSRSDYPSGCFRYGYLWNSGGNLGYNTYSSSTTSCSSSTPCLCLSAPECTKINGKEPNIAGCICGTKGCSAAGSYCDNSTSTCRTVPYCNKEDGRTTNNAACQCGTTKCTSDSGLFCFKSSNGAGGCDKVAHSFAYSQVKSGTCGSVSGRGDITDKATCESVARNLGFSDTTADEGSYSDEPPGCIRSSWGDLVYNPLSSSTTSCSSSTPCLCLSAPECTKINGNEPNTASCICGTKGCSAAGSYCDKSISICSTISSCSEKDGLTANSAACQCGSTKCTTEAGLFCNKNAGQCDKVDNSVAYSLVKSGTCVSVSGRVGITDKATCKSAARSLGFSDTTAHEESESDYPPGCYMKAGSLHYNTKSSSTTSCSYSYYSKPNICLCLSAPECTKINGKEPNTAGCICGTKGCDSFSGLICDSVTSTCSAADCGGDDISNITQQNCKTFNSRCQCSKCKKGWFTKDCSQTCPAPAVALRVDFTFVILAVWSTTAYLYFQNAELEQTESAKEAEEAANDMRGDANDVKDQGSAIVEESGSTAAGKLIAKQANAARAKAKMFTQKFTQKIKSLQRIIVARMQVLTAILASIMWSPEVPTFLLDFLKMLGGFFTFDVPGLLSSPDCVFGAGTNSSSEGAAMTPIDKWYISLLVPFGLILLVAIPTYYYRTRHKADQNNKNYERMANGWNNVCTQLSVVWIFATVVTTSFSILDCDKGTEGRLIMDPDVMCPLSSGIVESITTDTNYSKVESGTCGSVSGRVDITDKATCETAAGNLGFSDTTAEEFSSSNFGRLQPSYPSGCYRQSNGNLYYNTDSSSTSSCSPNYSCLCEILPFTTDIYDKDVVDNLDPGPAVLGIIVLVVYCFGILAFLYTAIKIAFTSVKERLKKAYRIRELETRARKRNKKKMQRAKAMEEIEKMDEIAKADAIATMQAEKKKDDAEAAKDQIEIDQANESTDAIEESDTWKSVGWLMEDYRYPIFELWNVFSRGLILMASTIFYPTNRWYTHITIMSVSLFITGASRPYVDNESNMVSILFCVIDILGAISAWQSSNAFLKEGNEPTPGFQTVFVIALMFALLVVVVLAFKAMGERIRILHDTMTHGTNNRSIWRVYTKCEVIFLFPILVIVFVVSNIAKVLCLFNPKNKNRSKIVPK